MKPARGANRKDITGMRFGQLLVEYHSHDMIYPESRTRRMSYWMCRCDCGRQTAVARSNLTRVTRSCGCMMNRVGKASQNWKGVGDIPSSWFSCLRGTAKSREIEFRLTLEYVWDLFCKQNSRCALTGLELTFSKQFRKPGQLGTASLDRIDSSQGYIPDNVQWVHKDVNFMKQSLSQERFIELCSLVTTKVQRT
jgi:hypothetical protein